MSAVDTHNRWAPGSTTAPSTSTSVSPSRKSRTASNSPSKEHTVIVIDDSDPEGNSDSGSDTEQSAVEAHLLRDSASNNGSIRGSRSVHVNGNKMDIDHITDARDPRTPTTTHEPPTSPSVSPKGWSSQQGSPSRGGGQHTPMAIPVALPVPPPVHGSAQVAAPPPFTTQPLANASTQSTNLSQPLPSQPAASQPAASQAQPPKAKESPKLPPKPLQQPTVRLEFYVEEPESYEVDILAMAKSKGMRLPTPPPPDKDSSDSEEDDDKEPEKGPGEGLLGGHIPAGGALAAAMAQAAGGAPAETVMDAPAPKRRKRRNRDYDLDDPFIDDIDLAIDERRYIAQTTLQGFYVSAGDVSLVEQETGSNAGTNINPFTQQPYPNNLNQPQGTKLMDIHGNKALDIGVKRGPGRPPKRAAGPVGAVAIAKTLLSRPLGKKGDEEIGHHGVVAAAANLELNGPNPGSHEPSALGTGAHVDGLGTHDSPIVLAEEVKQDLEGGLGAGQKRKRDSTPPTDDPNKRRKMAKILPFPSELEAQLDVLQKAIAKHDFANKGKFPPDLKPILLSTAILAITVQSYDDNFFNYLPKIFPYNRFTMLKLTKRLAYKDHIRMVNERQAALLAELQKMVDEGMESAKVEYERSVQLWEDRKARKKWEEEKKVEGAIGMEGVEFQSTNAPVVKETDKDDKDKEDKEGEDGDGDEDKDKAPQTRYRLNETMRGYLWALVQLSNDVCTLTNEKNHLEGSKELVSDQSQRKELYKKIMQAFPDGWMNTGTISREVSMMKKKMESAAPKTEDGVNPSTIVAGTVPATS